MGCPSLLADSPVLLEFQAQDDRSMALRVLTCTALLLLELARNQPPEVAGERLPAVLPVVLHNGTEPWTAAPDMGSLITPVGPWLAPYQPAQRFNLIDLQRVAADALPHRNLLRAVARLEQASMTLVERVAAVSAGGGALRCRHRCAPGRPAGADRSGPAGRGR